MNEAISIQFETNAESFEKRVLPFLTAREAENCLPIGIIARLVRNQRDGKTDPAVVMGAVMRDGRVRGVASMTPPHNVVITRMCEEEVDALAAALAARRIAVPGVHAPAETSATFARLWSARMGATFGGSA